MFVYLIYLQDADSAMEKYAQKRTYDGEVETQPFCDLNLQGVTIPSQRRYIRYYGDIVNFGMPSPPVIILKSVKIGTSSYRSPRKSGNSCEIAVAYFFFKRNNHQNILSS